MAAAVLVAALQLILGRPRPAPCCDGASHGATQGGTHWQAGPQADKAAPVDLLLRPEVQPLLKLRLRRSQPLVVAAAR